MKKYYSTKVFFVLGLLGLGTFIHLSWGYKQTISESDWFPFLPENTHASGVIGMQSWLDAPAGRHGFVQVEKEQLVFENGQPIKFWGTNINGSNAFPSREAANEFTNFLAKYGVNAVRFHKFTWNATDEEYSVIPQPEKFGRLDYFHARLKENGIYTGWSAIYGHRVLPGDSSSLLAYQEVKNLSYPWSHLNGSTSSLVNFAPDLQELNIALTVNMLNRSNPYTGLRYAEDPALAFVEFQNEDNIFWSAIERSLEQAPTYRALLCRQFSQWLQAKYGTQEQLEKAWGSTTIPENESLEQQNIYPQPNHGFFSKEYEVALERGQHMPVHVTDKMRFLYEQQVAYYRKFEKAVRETGYKGVIVGSCWQAGSGISHLYNLHADYLVGMIDRHNYFGGGAGGHQLATGPVKNTSMLKNPGSGLLSTGMQQVRDRPFSFSEWMSLVPNQWTAEAAPIVAAYGMGLQGWDASFSFAVDIPRFSPLLESANHGVYNATSPLHMGLYPALSRMVYRGDLQESPVLGSRKVHVGSFENEIPGFVEKVAQGYDDKRFSGSLSPASLAIGKVPLEFTDEPEDTQLPDLSPYRDNLQKMLLSVTGELAWNFDRGYFTIDSPGSKGLVGIMPDNAVSLEGWTIESPNEFAVILLTSLHANKDLQEADSILLTTVARARNTGMEYSASGDVLEAKGTSPLLLEPVDLRLGLPKGRDFYIQILDHDGRVTDKQLITGKGALEVSGTHFKSLYYLLLRK
ncbi:beta-galactosidase [Cyclobacterium jeungdonense]|uniref:Beta-galactosidase n=1 Tax=Cyclobacterium jeungdonense TaxID=708087 RepID=A0ABT8C574_9BACT|nr:beta-galactosidase [Cyclobacterium jeungdonense]MDN3686865.1 beta-galactosidase [Cyclobacterium jeungdonense]